MSLLSRNTRKQGIWNLSRRRPSRRPSGALPRAISASIQKESPTLSGSPFARQQHGEKHGLQQRLQISMSMHQLPVPKPALG